MVKFVGSYLLGIALLALFTMSTQVTFAQKKYKKKSKINYRKVEYIDSSIGYASFYADKFVGRKTANGELFSQKKFTCAHNSLPLGTMIRVTNLSNQLFVDVMRFFAHLIFFFNWQPFVSVRFAQYGKNNILS